MYNDSDAFSAVLSNAVFKIKQYFVILPKNTLKKVKKSNFQIKIDFIRCIINIIKYISYGSDRTFVLLLMQ